jgi:hypothetical protein
MERRPSSSRRSCSCGCNQDGTSLVLKVGDATRDHLLQADPETFFITTTTAAYPYVLAHLDRLSAADVAKLIERAIAFSGVGAPSQRSHGLNPP